ncbi:MAG: hypothetical protein EZS28_002771 [Streblomastix strix]|uniref:Uncharacterized protein n=1 Tax=Streblomastix strix TaxID=222440 RepID=A0A5J4X4J5_9EUKA|nr:MAG: hypothetical protein EZS28_002771 [Streblomastix strix]
MTSESQIVSKIGGDKDELIVKLTKALRQQNYLVNLLQKQFIEFSERKKQEYESIVKQNADLIRIQKKILSQTPRCLDLKTQTKICQEEKLL